MGYVIRHSTGSINRARKKGKVAFGVSSKGYNKTSVSGLYNGVPPVAGKHNLVRVSSTNDPDFYTLSNAELINFANQLGGSASSVSTAKTYLNGRDDIMFTDEMSNNTIVSGSIFEFDFTSLNTYPGSGVVYYDLSGNNYHASASSNTTYVEYDSDYNVVNFGGGEVSGQGLFVQDLNYVTGNSDQLEELTIDTLVKASSLSSNSSDQRIILSFDRSSVFRFSIGGDAGPATTDKGKMSFMSPQTGDKNATNCPDLRDDKWHRLAVTFKSGAGNGLRYYVDGELVETDTSTYSPIGSQGTGETPRYGVIGAGSESTSGQPGDSTAPDSIFTGSMASIKYYNTQLSQTEILQNYYGGNIVTDGLTLSIDPGNLVSYEKDDTLTYNLTGSISGSVINGLNILSSNGGVFDFDGTDDLIRFGNQPSMLTNDITQEAWVNTDTMVNWHGIITNMDGWGTGFSLQIGPTQNIAAMVSGAYLKTSWTPSIGVWYHIVATHRSSDNYNALYVNGKLENTMTRAISYDGGDVIDIGCFYTGGSLRFNGQMGPVRTYNRALTPDEVLQNYNAQKARFL